MRDNLEKKIDFLEKKIIFRKKVTLTVRELGLRMQLSIFFKNYFEKVALNRLNLKL